MTALEIIKLLGGQAALAAELDIPFTTISSWGLSNQIPDWRKPRLLELASRKNLALSTADFPAREERIARRSAA